MPPRGYIVLEANYLNLIALAYLSRNDQDNIATMISTTTTTTTTSTTDIIISPKLLLGSNEIIYVNCLEKDGA